MEEMYNIYDEEATITENEDGTATVKFDNTKKDFADCEKAVKFLEKNGYRF